MIWEIPLYIYFFFYAASWHHAFQMYPGTLRYPVRNYMFKVNNKNTSTYFTPCPSVSSVSLKQENA